MVKMSLPAVSRSVSSVLRCLATTARATAGLGRTCSSRLVLGRPLQECCYSSSPVNSKIKVLPSSPLFARDLSAETAGEVTEPPLPPYVPRKGEEVEVKRARLLYQSRYVVESVESALVSCRSLVSNAWPAPWTAAALLKPFVASSPLPPNTRPLSATASCGYLLRPLFGDLKFLIRGFPIL